MRVLRGCIVFLALGPGLFMTFDGLRALILGDYLTPASGPYAGQLGPWSGVVGAVGIAPRSSMMKILFVLFGLGWLGADAAFVRRPRWGAGALAVVAVATLWYLPVGTLVSALVLVGLALLRTRTHTPMLSVLMCFAFAATPALADRWMPPGETSYFSKDNAFRLRVSPRALSSSADYWHDYDQGPRKSGQLKGGQDVCIGQLEQRAADGSYAVVWKRELVNAVAPVTALVTADGSHVVTFDNWHSMGYGADVVVIYGLGGKLIASLGLSDFLPTEQIAKLPRSVSSIRWRRAHHFDEAEEHVVLEVVAGDPGKDGDRSAARSISISLIDGRVDRSLRRD